MSYSLYLFNRIIKPVSKESFISLFRIIGEQVYLKENDLLKSETQCILSNWMVLFNKKSCSPALGIEKIKYFELRPIQYK